MTDRVGLGRFHTSGREGRWLATARPLLPIGWVLGAVGYYGPWIAHPTSALTLSGVDMGEFVKFLPGALDGSLPVVRQLFYLPALAVVVSVALLIGSHRLAYPRLVRALALFLAVPVSLQLLPPAWSPSSLMTAEFRPQAIALGVCWLLLAGFWLWARLPRWILASLSALLSLAGVALPAWQFLAVEPAIERLYSPQRPQSLVGWGFFVCLAGLLLVAGGSVLLALPERR